MTKTKLCCLFSRCLLMVCCNNIQIVYDWSWWHSWNAEEIDDDSIYPHSSIRIHHTVVFYYSCKEDHTFCLHIHRFLSLSHTVDIMHNIGIWPLSLLLKDDDGTLFLFEKSEPLFSSTSSYKKQHYHSFMTINVTIMSTEPFYHLYIVVIFSSATINFL